MLRCLYLVGGLYDLRNYSQNIISEKMEIIKNQKGVKMSYFGIDNQMSIRDNLMHHFNEQKDELFGSSTSSEYARCKHCVQGEQCIVEIDEMCEGRSCDFHSYKWFCGGHPSECKICAVREFCLDFKKN